MPLSRRLKGGVWSNQFDVADSKSLSQFIDRDDRWISPAALEAAEVLLTESGALCNFLLRQPVLPTQTSDVSPHQLPHVHGGLDRGLHILSLSTVGCNLVVEDFREVRASMDNKQLALNILLGGFGLGMVSLASPSVRDFVDGLLGIPLESAAGTSGSVGLRADLAASALREPLAPEESDELVRGFAFHSTAQYADAVPIIGKYAMLGDDNAQATIGGMYLFGHGLPVDRVEGLRWLALAATQGNRSAAKIATIVNATPDWDRRVAALSTAMNATAELERSDSASGLAYTEGPSPTPQYGPGVTAQRSSSSTSGSVLSGGSSPAAVTSGIAPIGTRASIGQAYGLEPAGRRYSGTQVGPPSIDSSAPVILNRAGPGTYSEGSGDIYTQAGPHGVVNTRTGVFSPTN